MMTNIKRMLDLRLPVFIMLAAFILLPGCAGSRQSDGDIIAYVNKDPIYDSDLKREIAMRAKFDPGFNLTSQTAEEQLDAIIDRKIMVQSAMEKGLARQDKFVDTIRMIWEHTLIRDFIEYKKKEFADYLFATDEEIQDYYKNMSHKATFRVFKSRDNASADAVYDKYLKENDDSGWVTVGPIAYEDVSSIALLDAFKMEDGNVGKFFDDQNYYVIRITAKEITETAPIETLKGDIEKRVILIKEKRLFDDWLKEQRKRSKVTIKAVQP